MAGGGWAKAGHDRPWPAKGWPWWSKADQGKPWQAKDQLVPAMATQRLAVANQRTFMWQRPLCFVVQVVTDVGAVKPGLKAIKAV